MTRLYRTAPWICVVTLLAVFATACTKHYTRIPVAQLRQMTPFKAKVENITVDDVSKLDAGTGIVAIGWLKTEQGKRVTIGGTLATSQMIGFLRSPKAGQTYLFPQVLVDYEKKTGQKVE